VNQEQKFGRICGIDYGTVRVGLALTDTAQQISTPCDIYRRRTEPLDAKYFRDFALEEKIILFVVGLPVHGNGSESQKSREARKFGDWLNKLTNVTIEYFDERYTSVEAEQLLRDAGLRASERKGKIDKIAAHLMLSAYLESRGHDGGDPGALDG
jgi:putative holliday junction resolvase